MHLSLRPLSLVVLSSCLWVGCTSIEAVTPARPTEALPSTLVQRLQLPGAVVERSLVPVDGLSDAEQSATRYLRGILDCGTEQARFVLLLPAAPRPVPFLLLLPILAGGEDLMWMVGAQFLARGYAVGWTARVGPAMRAGQRAAELDQLFRKTIVQNRMLLSWVRTQAELDPNRLVCVGLSTGGILSVALAALEPDLRGVVPCLAGADLPDLLLHSDEGRVRDWRRWRLQEDGLAGSQLARELREELTCDPLHYASAVASERVLLIGARYDQVIPRRNQDRLWEILGRPQRQLIPLGHYSTGLILRNLVGRIHTFLSSRLE